MYANLQNKISVHDEFYYTIKLLLFQSHFLHMTKIFLHMYKIYLNIYAFYLFFGPWETLKNCFQDLINLGL